MGFKASSTRFTAAKSAQSSDLVAYNNATGGTSVAGSAVNASTVISTVITTPGSAATTTTVASGPTIANVQYLDANNAVISGDIAVSTAGGNILITGSGFVANSSIYVNNTLVTNTYISTTQIRAILPAASAGNVALMIFTPSNVGGIKTNAIRYSGAPVWTTAAVSLQNATAANVALVATSDSTLSYALQSGSTLPTNISLLSSGYLVGTPTGYSTNTTSTAVIVATDQEGQATQQTLNITVTVSDPQFNYTTLLLNGETAVTPFIADASTNNFPLIITGDSKANTFSPYLDGYYSNLFNGTSDLLTIPNDTTFAMGTGNFTIDAWVFPTATTSTYGNLIYKGDGSTYVPYGVVVSINGSSSYVKLFCSSTGSSWDINPSWTGTLNTNQWYHIAAVRNGTTFTVYVNGVAGATTATSSASLMASSTTTCIGAFSASTGSQWFPGYISNLRVIKGTALYTTAFTPPTTPSVAVANTSLITCQSSRFVDNSLNALTVTLRGSPQVSPAHPFTTLNQVVPKYYGTKFIDTAGFGLATPYSANTNPGTGDFTVEFWVYIKSITGQVAIQSCSSSGVGSGTGFRLSIGATGTMALDTDASIISSSSSSVTFGSWHHIALTRSGTTFTIYLDGASVGTGSLSRNFSGDATYGFQIVGVASSGTYSMNGYVSNFRFIKGQSIFTGAFTPTTSPLTRTTIGHSGANVAASLTGTVQLLTCQDNTLKDNSLNNYVITANDPSIVPAKLGPPPFTSNATTNTQLTTYGSGYFDGNGDWLQGPTSSSWAFGTGDFTVELWVYLTATPSAISDIIGNFFTAVNTNWGLCINTSRQLQWQTYGSIIIAYGAPALALNTWHHIAVARTGTTTQLFLNGVSIASASDSTNYSTVDKLGIAYAGDNYITGYVSDVRIVKGTALYTANFVPPAALLTAVTNTQLLTCQYNGGGTNYGIIDNSIFDYPITRYGNATQGTFSPYSQMGWSNYFNGTTDYLSSSAIGAIGTNNFTIECWYYYTGGAPGTKQLTLISNLVNADNTTWDLQYYNGGFRFVSYSPTFISGTNTLVAGTWNHIAVTRSGTTGTIWLNGTSIGSSSSFTNTLTTNSAVKIGWNGFNDYWQGYISNARVVNGTALYTTTFTPTTTPLTAVANTSLLTCQINRFKDSSTNAYTITPNGTPSVQAYSPFAPGVSYTPSLHGGSAYFDGTGDYLSATNNAIYDITASDFTVEAWVYRTASAEQYIIHQRPASGNSGWGFEIYTANQLRFYYTGGSAITGTATIPLNSWNHVAAVRSGTTFKTFVNGIIDANTTIASGTASTSNVYIGTDNTPGSLSMTGYLSDVRLTKGAALYSANFTPATSTITSNVASPASLLLNFTNGGTIDVHSTTVLETVGNAQISTSVKKYGNASLSFNGTSQYLVSPADSASSTSYNFGAGDWTVEGWFYPASTGTRLGGVLVGYGTTAAQSSVQIDFAANNTVIGSMYSSSSAYSSTASGTYSANTWQHVAVVRSGANVTCYLNGSGGTSTSVGSNIANYSSGNTRIYVGTILGGVYFNGSMDDLRVTKGFARYTANFTAPTTGLLGQ